ncbi:sentrin-specific protease 2 isoform X2 [Rhinatrema bivittatum]|uniref:sentrin-specific protease 2 isoform X2 n=1 Tax=Rhinatrema bivittatum TaxID=194408 RepID=UPI00112D0609|nr:sentrin-specific protease 2 isoform X2 [Rhinatrema bivittatum]
MASSSHAPMWVGCTERRSEATGPGMYKWVLNSISSWVAPQHPECKTQASLISCRKRARQSVHQAADDSEWLPTKKQRLERGSFVCTVKKTISDVASLIRFPSPFTSPYMKPPHKKVQTTDPTNEVLPLTLDSSRNGLDPYTPRMDLMVKYDQKLPTAVKSCPSKDSTYIHYKAVPCFSKSRETCNAQSVNTSRRHGALQEGLLPRHMPVQHSLTCAASRGQTQRKVHFTVEEGIQEEEKEKYKQLLQLVKDGYQRKHPIPVMRAVHSKTQAQAVKKPGHVLEQEGVQKLDSELSDEVAIRLCLRNKKSATFEHNNWMGLQTTQRKDSKELPKLTEKMEIEIQRALGHGDEDEILSSAFKLQLTRGDIWTLKNHHWLNDEVINFYLSLLVERNKEQHLPRLHVFSTFFYPKLYSGGYYSVRRWTKHVNLFENDLILIPIHLRVHWSLVAVDLRKKTIAYHDSMGQKNPGICKNVLKYLQEESKATRNQSLDLAQWTLNSMSPHEIPQQMNGSDCGVFICKYADCISKDQLFSFTQRHMPHFRKMMVWEILHQKLL